MAKPQHHSPNAEARTRNRTEWVVRPAASDDLHTARFLGRHYFGGSRDDGERYIYGGTTDPDYPHGYAVVAEANSVIVGVGVLHVKRPGCMHDLLDIPELLPYEMRDTIPSPVDGFSGPISELGWIQLVAVDKAWWGNGIATCLFQKLVDWTTTHRIRTLAGVSWQRDAHRDSSRLFERYEFECIAEYDSFYAENDDRKFCPDCGENCECAGRIYVRDLAQTTETAVEL